MVAASLRHAFIVPSTRYCPSARPYSAKASAEKLRSRRAIVLLRGHLLGLGSVDQRDAEVDCVAGSVADASLRHCHGAGIAHR